MTHRVRVHVTAEDIAAGILGNALECPVARAFLRVLRPGVVAGVHQDVVTVGQYCNGVNYHWRSSPAVRHFTIAYDAGLPVDPFTFALNLPERFVPEKELAR